MGKVDESPLRQRSRRQDKTSRSPPRNLDADIKNEIVWGKTPNGTVFRVPTTYDVLSNLFHPARPKSHLDLVNLALLALQLFLFYALPRRAAQFFFASYFVFWRAAYDGGLGWILTKQSKHRWIVREIQRRAWLDENKRPEIYRWIRDQLKGKMGEDYSFDTLPVEYNAWLLFRQLVDIILVNDFLSYTLFALTCFRIPEGLSTLLHILRWFSGIILIAFNIWVKIEAHRVVKDYGWYWGDVFFERGALVFDGVFEMAPHPMYSVGYAGYYGLSLIVGSYPVLFASLAAHIAQFAFLVYFENPHIERMYGQRKLMSLRTPVVTDAANNANSSDVLSSANNSHRSAARSLSIDHSTPSATDGETASETEDVIETETEPELDEPKGVRPSTPRPLAQRSASSKSSAAPKESREFVSQHDLLARFFRKDPIGLRNLDLLRAGDAKLALLVLYAAAAGFLPVLNESQYLILHFVHALAWRFIHSFGLGLLLREQSRRKYMVRHFMEHYYYPKTALRQGPLEEAFASWKSLYNMSLCMTYVSFFALTWKTYVMPTNWAAGDQLLRHILGSALVSLHVWTAVQSYEVLGVFGWFFGDFFLEDYPATLDYTGIYRYLNNPERTMSGAAFFGMALVSGSKIVFALAAISHLSHWWFLSCVEDPHMKKVYGPSLRKEAGLTRTIKRLALKNAKVLESTPGSRYAPDVRRVAQELRGTVEKVYEDATGALEEFLAAPKLSDVVQDTMVLLQQSREKLVITRLAHDLTSYDVSKYQLKFASGRSVGGRIRFHLGEHIRIQWKAPPNHSRRDWIGIYRVGANKSTFETRTTSLGMWLGVYNDEWDGNVPIDIEQSMASVFTDGTLVFADDRIPWQVGTYELRYHHDGKHNVMALGGPFEIYVSKPSNFDFTSVRACLLQIVTYCLEADPSLLPSSSALTIADFEPDADLSSDDFRFWSDKQAKRIAVGIKAAFGLEYAHEVILADANLTTLANRILAARELIQESGNSSLR